MKITAYFLGAVLLIFSCAGCDFVYRLLDKQGAEEKELVGEVTPFEKNPTIEEIQTLLKIYGYNAGRIDGILGPRTRDSIAKFQKDNGLEVSRFVDQPTWSMLSAFKYNGLVKEGELNVELVQAILKEAGFDPGKVDGKFGAKTQQAIKDFQKARSLKVDGKVGYKTLLELSRHLRPVNSTAYKNTQQ